MGVKKLIFRLLPVTVFVSLRSKYRLILKAVYKPLTEPDFINILTKRMGISKGDVIFIHSSVDALNIRFSAYRLLEILLDTVGPDGTLVFPAWHFTYRAEDYLKQDKIFNVRKSPSALGLLSELARRHKDAVRSIHPTTSIVAIGKKAVEITTEHGKTIYPCDENSPFYKLLECNGKIVGLGVDTNFLSFVHCPEDVIKGHFPIKTRTDKVYDAKVIDNEGNTRIIKTLAAHEQIQYRDINRFLKHYISDDVCENFTDKGNRFFIADASRLFKRIIDLSSQNITIYTNKAVIRNIPKS